mgnify:CR=1 FL=1
MYGADFPVAVCKHLSRSHQIKGVSLHIHAAISGVKWSIDSLKGIKDAVTSQDAGSGAWKLEPAMCLSAGRHSLMVKK